MQNDNFNNDKANVIIDSVIRGINQNWPTIYKIRYIYLEIGKEFYSDTDFFLSVDGKLGKDNLSISDIKQIYNSKTGRDLKVICKSASYILKKAYDKVGIKSELVETNTTIAALNDEEEFLINHWFLAIYDDNDVYFATLTPDLPYIQLNMETRHFASDIPYKRDYNGKIMQIYKGDEIKHSVISRTKLKEIDIAIGYINNYYNYNDNKWSLGYDDVSLYILKDNLRNNKLFYELEKCQTSFYKNLINFEGDNHRKISLIDDKISTLTDKDWNLWIKIMCKQVLVKIEDILGYKIYVLPDLDSSHWNYESWLLNLCVQIQRDLFKKLNNSNNKENFKDIKIDVINFKYNKWSRKVKKKFGCDNVCDNYDNILAILDKTNALVNCVKNKDNNSNFSELFSSLTYHFIDSKHLFKNNISSDGYLSNYYIANKFDKLFRMIFSCNEVISNFNKMGYSEQVVIIKEILNLMFPEINRSNSIKLTDYNDNYSAVLNRIQLYPIKSKKNGDYSILFNILGDNKYGDYYFFYNPKENIFKISNALDIYNDYIIVSNRMKNRMSVNGLEQIDDLNGKAIKK